MYRNQKLLKGEFFLIVMQKLPLMVTIQARHNYDLNVTTQHSRPHTTLLATRAPRSPHVKVHEALLYAQPGNDDGVIMLVLRQRPILKEMLCISQEQFLFRITILMPEAEVTNMRPIRSLTTHDC